MNLENIKEIECPICKCLEITEEIRTRKHTNGYWNQYRTFDCGMTLHFFPNCMKVYQKGRCKHDPEFIKRFKLRHQLKNKLIKVVKESDVDEEFAEELIERIGWCRVDEC